MGTTNSDRRVHGFEVACGHVGNTTRSSIRFREKSIVKLPFYIVNLCLEDCLD